MISSSQCSQKFQLTYRCSGKSLSQLNSHIWLKLKCDSVLFILNNCFYSSIFFNYQICFCSFGIRGSWRRRRYDIEHYHHSRTRQTAGTVRSQLLRPGRRAWKPGETSRKPNLPHLQHIPRLYHICCHLHSNSSRPSLKVSVQFVTISTVINNNCN